MKKLAISLALGIASVCAGPATAGGPGPGCAPPPSCPTPQPFPGPAPSAPSATPAAPAQPGQPAQTTTPPTDINQPAGTDAFAQAPPTGGEAAQSALPNMVGDLGFYGLAPRLVQSTSSVSPVNGLGSGSFTSSFSSFSSSSSSSSSLSNRVPVTNFGSFKISDNGTVVPEDRVFLTYNYYNVDGLHTTGFAIHREDIGFEKSFLDGKASVGMRLPYTQLTGDFGSDDIGDLSIILKYALYRDCETGSALSAGIVVTVPTGPDIHLAPGSSINPTLLQPFVGYCLSVDRFYLLGFSEIVVPTDSVLPTFVANDIGVGYRCERVPVIPTFEVHVNDGLNHRGSLVSPFGFVDSVVLTGGVHTVFKHSSLTVGVATPVTGPQLYSVEGIVQFNWRF